jgi:hypothetical protein
MLGRSPNNRVISAITAFIIATTPRRAFDIIGIIVFVANVLSVVVAVIADVPAST